MGTILVAGRLIHDWHPFGVLTVAGFWRIRATWGRSRWRCGWALRDSTTRFAQFGIGQLTGIELPGENRGLLRPLDNWTPSSIGSIAMGQEVSVTPMQIISAISAIANGGMLYRPRVVREVRGGIKPVSLPGGAATRVTDPRTAATMREMMEDVVLRVRASLRSSTATRPAGKSGTAQKIDPATGRYSRTQYNASFVGFAPVNDPAISILVVLDSPVGCAPWRRGRRPRVQAGCRAGAGVPRRAARRADRPRISRRQRIRIRSRQARRWPWRRREASEARFEAAIAREKRSARRRPLHSADPDGVAVPDLTGQTVRGVTEACSRLGLVPSLIGNGIALQQFPDAGTSAARQPRDGAIWASGQLVTAARRSGN